MKKKFHGLHANCWAEDRNWQTTAHDPQGAGTGEGLVLHTLAVSK